MPTDPFIPIAHIELSGGKATIFQDGSVMLKRIVINFSDDSDFATWEEEQQFPLSKQDLEKLTKFCPNDSSLGLDNSPKP